MAVADRAQGFIIGSGSRCVTVENPLVLAPMAGVCDMPYRLICKEMGCGLSITEMISAMGLKYGDCNTLKILEMSEDERPVAAQVFGSDPEVVAMGPALWRPKGRTS